MSVPDFGEIAEQLRRATVLIRCRNSGNGSGIMWSKEGSIVSNAHVISSSRPTVQLWDGREFEATVISRDPRRDLAALRISASGLPAAAARDAFSVRPGELAIAIGNPLGFVGAMATGVIHAIGPIRGLGSQTWLQAGIRLAPGNSGGPLADGRGRVIGVNTMVAGRLALAVPSNAVWDFLTAGSLDSWLGVTVRPVRVPGVKGGENTFGLLVVEIGMDSPAANASLLAGDILLGTEAGPFKSLDDFRAELRNAAARTIRFEFLRGDYQRRRRVTVQLGKQSPWRGGVAA